MQDSNTSRVQQVFLPRPVLLGKRDVHGAIGSGHRLEIRPFAGSYPRLWVRCNENSRLLASTRIDWQPIHNKYHLNCQAYHLLAYKMCNFTIRVFTCGHWKKSLKSPCDDAMKKKEVCDGGNEDSKTTGMLCDESGCDEKPEGRRDGPGT